MKKKILVYAMIAIVTLTSISITVSAISVSGNSDVTLTTESQEPEPTEQSETEKLQSTEPTEQSETEETQNTEPTEETTQVVAPIVDETEDEWISQNRVAPERIPEFVQGDMEVYSPEDTREAYVLCGSPYVPTYRAVYYYPATCFSDLVDEDSFSTWYQDVYMTDFINGIEPQEMYLVSFVKHFKIPREDFEKCVENIRQTYEWFHDTHGDDISDEIHELPNADIIYTFDNEIINNYYRRDICTYTEYVPPIIRVKE